MRKTVFVFVGFLAVLVILGGSEVALAGGKPPKPPKEPQLGTEYRITDEPQGQGYPRIYGNTIVWSDERDVEQDIWIYYLGPNGVPFDGDHEKEGEYELAADPERLEDCPRIHGNIIVFRRRESPPPTVNWDLHMYHLGPDGLYGTDDSPEGEYRITETAEIESPAHSLGTLVALTRTNTGSLLLDLGENEMPDPTDLLFEIPNTLGASNAALCDTMAVYAKDGDFYIYGFGPDGKPGGGDDWETHLPKPGDVTHRPIMCGDTMVWNEDRYGNSDVYWQDLRTGEERQITTSTDDDLYPRIHGHRIVWHRHIPHKRWPKDDVFVHDLLTGETHQLTTSGKATRPDVFGDHVVYMDSRDGNTDVYLFILDEGGGSQSAGAGKTPEGSLLSQSCPNPCSRATTVRFQVPGCRLQVAGDRQLETGNWQHVSLSIYDISGRVVATLVDARLPAGSHHVTWETNDTPSGVYFYKLSTGDFSAARKMLVLK